MRLRIPLPFRRRPPLAEVAREKPRGEKEKRKESDRTTKKRERKLRDIWIMERWPLETLDACRINDPPFADINGVNSVIEQLVDSLVGGRGGSYIIVGLPGSGKSTLLKTLNSRFQRGGIYSIYIDASGRSLDELLAILCSLIGCEEASLDSFSRRVRELVLKRGPMAILIDNIDRLRDDEDLEDASKMLTTLASLQHELKHDLLVALSMLRESLARLSLDPLIRGIIKSYMEIVDLDEHLVNSPTDLSRLIYAHFERARPQVLDKKKAAILKKNPLHPIKDQTVVATLFDIIGPDTPRVYLEHLNELLQIAIRTRSRLVTLAHVNILARSILQARRGRLPPQQLQSLLVRRYVNGLLAGGLVAVGSLAITLVLVNLAPPALRLPYVFIGIIFIAAGVAIHMRSISSRF